MVIEPETSIEIHAPYMNFMGPGTHIVDRVNRRVMPRNKTDFVALLHDIDYLRTAGSSFGTAMSDLKAIWNADKDIYGAAMTAGLLARLYGNLKFNPPTRNKQLGQQLMDIVKNSPEYEPLFTKYKVSKWLY